MRCLLDSVADCLCHVVDELFCCPPLQFSAAIIVEPNLEEVVSGTIYTNRHLPRLYGSVSLNVSKRLGHVAEPSPASGTVADRCCMSSHVSDHVVLRVDITLSSRPLSSTTLKPAQGFKELSPSGLSEPCPPEATHGGSRSEPSARCARSRPAVSPPSVSLPSRSAPMSVPL